jgi:hypothetical protein
MGNTGASTYIPALYSILPAGTHAISVLYSADENHCAAGDITSITINKALSGITWNNTADIDYGTPLSVTQLNATVSGTSGSATYSPAFGIILPLGIQTLTVTFEADANYEGVTKSVTIQVKNATTTETLTEEDGVSIYPNPFTNIIHLKIPELKEVYTLTITNTNGDVILSK